MGIGRRQRVIRAARERERAHLLKFAVEALLVKLLAEHELNGVRRFVVVRRLVGVGRLNVCHREHHLVVILRELLRREQKYGKNECEFTQ